MSSSTASYTGQAYSSGAQLATADCFAQIQDRNHLQEAVIKLTVCMKPHISESRLCD